MNNLPYASEKNAKILEIEISIIPKYTMDLMYMDIVLIGRFNAMEKLGRHQ